MLAAQRFDLPLWQVPLLLAPFAVITAVAMSLRIKQPTTRKLAVIFSALLVGGCLAMALGDVDLFQIVTQENNVIEWLSAIFMLLAACMACGAALRFHRQARPSPVATVLATGFAWGFTRELEYGGQLVGKQFWFTRNIFRPKSFVSISYFEKFQQKMELPYDPAMLYALHLALTALCIVILLLVGRYVFRHRQSARLEIKRFLQPLHGRLYLAGVGLYILGAIVGGILHRLPKWYDSLRLSGALCRSLVEESVECWAAMLLWFCAFSLWQASQVVSVQPPAQTRILHALAADT